MNTELELAPALSKDSKRLANEEARIERSQRNAYLEIGLALAAIRDEELYKAPREKAIAGRYSFTTFEEYCEQKWEMDIRRANQLVETASAAEKMGKIFPVLPSRESHVRELLKLSDEKDRASVWQRVVSSGATVTAKTISDEIVRFTAEKDKNWITLEEWAALSKDDKIRALEIKPDHSAQFNYQDTDNIEWARWSWNPVTGCNHGCPYCYARDISERFYPQKFAPSIIPSRLCAPSRTTPKSDPGWNAVDKMGHKNVFTCSMADLFGKWVPTEWIESVMEQVYANKQWNFLFLSKFPQRMQEFEFPKNAWVGTTVDKQGAVARAEKAFEKINASVKWLSCEPMLERLTFNSLDMFNWVVIGGASRSSQTDEWFPPYTWIAHLMTQAEKVNAKVYMKDNLFGRNERIRQYPI